MTGQFDVQGSEDANLDVAEMAVRYLILSLSKEGSNQCQLFQPNELLIISIRHFKTPRNGFKNNKWIFLGDAMTKLF